MAYTNAQLQNTNSYVAGLQSKVASNSLDVAVGTLLKLTGGDFIEIAGAGDTIEGVSVTVETFASDNETVAQALVTYKPADPVFTDTYMLPISGGTVTAVDVGKFYDIDATQVVNGASESTTTGQLRLEKFISATVGIFSIQNK